MIGIGLALALVLQATPSGPDLSARIAPVTAAIAAEQTRQAALPPATSDRERLERMGELDQVGRRAAILVDLSDVPDADRKAAELALWAPVGKIDDQLSAELLTLLPPEGWFYKSVYGDKAAGAAFLIVQHGEPEFQRRFVPVLELLVAKGEVEGTRYALMYDRLAVNEGRPQRYGTQMMCKNARWVIDYENLEDPEHAQARRDAIGFLGYTLEQYAAGFSRYPPCTED